MNMVVGDLVKWNNKTGVVVRVFEHKVWRTKDLGKNVDFGKINPEPFAEVMVSGSVFKVPQVDLQLVAG
tara:strand:- start:443 stop:649 length:207 start_codon:yes stop_codon:yes gene_type:complete